VKNTLPTAMIDWENIMEDAGDNQRPPFTGEQVVQLSCGAICSVIEVSLDEVRLSPHYKRAFYVKLETFWERYSSVTY